MLDETPLSCIVLGHKSGSMLERVPQGFCSNRCCVSVMLMCWLWPDISFLVV